MKKITDLLDEMEKRLPSQVTSKAEVSRSNVGWHIEHSLITINLIVGALQKSKSEDYKWRPNYKWMIIKTIGMIPRGRGRAPKVVQPINFNSESLKKHLETTRIKVQELKTCHTNSFFFHPYFGNLNLKPTIKFLEIHTKHHLKIINDILI